MKKSKHQVIEVRFSEDIFAAPRRFIIFEGTYNECVQWLNTKYMPCMTCAGTDVYIK